jgi:anti-sigma-K factor RskA
MVKHAELELIPLYAVGALSGEEKRKLEEHLAGGCELCEAELAQFQETVNRLPYGLTAPTLPADMKERIRAKVEAVDAQKPSRIRWASVLQLAAVAALFVIAASLYWKQNNLLMEREKQLETLDAQRQAELRDLELKLEQQKKEIGWLRDPSVQLALLTGAEPNSKGKMVWNPTLSQGIFYANALPQLAQQKTYELWVIGKNGPVAAGVFAPDQQGSVVLTITRISEPAEGKLQFAVTIEPAGGVSKPTGSIIMAGTPL